MLLHLLKYLVEAIRLGTLGFHVRCVDNAVLSSKVVVRQIRKYFWLE